MTILNNLQSFNLNESETTLWVFKKNFDPQKGLIYTGRWLETTDKLDNALKAAVGIQINKIEETQEYGLLTENNESSALTILKDETHADLMLKVCTDGTIANKKISKINHISNAIFYIIQFIDGENVLYVVRRTDNTWRTKKSSSLINAIFSDETLDISIEPSFSISKYVDFFILNDEIVILNKGHFEAVLNYKNAHKDDFRELQKDKGFSNVFSDLSPLVSNVGENKMQLRRMSAIRQKAYYKNSTFMNNLKNKGAEFGLNLNFDDNGKIIPCEHTWRDIIRALLDHRLASPFSENIYDVPDTKTVSSGQA